MLFPGNLFTGKIYLKKVFPRNSWEMQKFFLFLCFDKIKTKFFTDSLVKKKLQKKYSEENEDYSCTSESLESDNEEEGKNEIYVLRNRIRN